MNEPILLMRGQHHAQVHQDVGVTGHMTRNR
jgi:hypothetical protein